MAQNFRNIISLVFQMGTPLEWTIMAVSVLGFIAFKANHTIIAWVFVGVGLVLAHQLVGETIEGNALSNLLIILGVVAIVVCNILDFFLGKFERLKFNTIAGAIMLVVGVIIG